MDDQKADEWPDARRSADLHMQVLAGEMKMLRSDVAEMKVAFKEISHALSKIALVEERQTHMSASVERAFKEIEKIQVRLDKLEQAAPINNQTSKWLEMALIGCAGAVGSYILSHFFK
jgi:hypothetical protein